MSDSEVPETVTQLVPGTIPVEVEPLPEVPPPAEEEEPQP
jgi:hypothetical protein